MTARYLLCPGQVQSASDGQWHHVSASQLAMLYRVPLGDCLVLPADAGPLASTAAPSVTTWWICPACGLERRGGPPAACGTDNPDCPIR